MSVNLIYNPVFKTKIRGFSITFWINKFFDNFENDLNQRYLKLNNYFFYYIEPNRVIEFKELLKKNNNEFKSTNGLFAVINNDKDIDELNELTDLSDIIRVIPIDNHIEIERVVKEFQINYYLKKNVEILDFSDFYIQGLPEIGDGSVISKGVVIKGDVKIGNNSNLGEYSFVENTIISDNCNILPFCVLRDSMIEENVSIGPFAHLRNNAVVKKNAKMGNFVEMKKSVLGEGSKSMHLTYIGDAIVGKKVNIGAGTITCNYDGVNKNQTIIEDNVFVGSGTELVAPIKINKNSYIGAGSTITREVPEESLAIARAKQRNIEGWVKRKKKKK